MYSDILFLLLRKKLAMYFFYPFTVHSVDYLITHTNTCTHIYYLRSLKFTLKHLKRSYVFRSHDHPQGTYIVPC